jgi:hypothetical protein
MVNDTITVLARDVQLQYDEKEEFIEELKSLFSKYDLDGNTSRIFDGPLRAQTNIHTNCPDCEERLKILRPELDKENGATASARCSCGWNGQAVYRLIDLLKSVDYETSSWLPNSRSCVAENELNVDYYPYDNTEVHYL